ncbi:hypothetical protein PHLGIDRAFT_27734 [Phlebiopsis gigantea 11061_1 CR5-6]|uniref:Het-C-domain-containing protein n=1 Tax=Phlebiopsis gigantea (strain 11061_1 CR5-6) TaxID=745531 RepID=A0A0C3P1K6_PHLG1|nr:hypothetical protein PHLGIDRAFT_27734 [Phlebiopsis gigantea 11061_1 CR5-6]
MISSSSTVLILSLVVLILLPSQTYAFGAGEIPDFAYLNDKAFRHGDLENVLAELAKTAGGAAAGGGLFGMAQSILGAATGGSKFSGSDVKKVYFGNWLRDYSQAMDIAGLSKLTADTLVLIVSILGFLTFGFATEEFQVTAERLGVYLPVEHIDNPKGYAEKEGDARQFHPKLRPPVNPKELEIDARTGMKNYMASENRGWDTSTAHIRRTFKACIDYGRRAKGREGADLWEAYRLLGTGLHTMEDLLAHSNWCELALRKMGYEQVFCHVGDNVLVNTPNGEAPPLVTGTFGSADFLHSLMGEATDHLSQASVTDLTQNLANASQNDTDSSLLRSLLEKLPIGGASEEEKVAQADEMKAQAKAYQFNPDDVMPPEVQTQLLNLLKWRDGIYRDVLAKIELIPGLESLIDALTNALNAFVYTILAPYLTPVLQQVTSVLSEGSKAVIDSEDQYEVFDNADASDPSHSLLSKDHFALILNEPAGKTAQVVVRYSVKLIVDAWFNDNEDPNRVVDEILEAFHHPYFNTGRSRIQADMFEEMKRWINDLDREESERILGSLTKYGKSGNQGYGRSEDTYGGRRAEVAYGGQTTEEPSYGRVDDQPPARRHGGGGSEPRVESYGSSRYDQESSESYDGGRQTASSGGYVPSYQPSYAGASEQHGQSRNPRYGGAGGGYGQDESRSRQFSGYGGGHVRSEEPTRYGRGEEESGGYGRQESGYRVEEYDDSSRRHGRRQPEAESGYGRQEGERGGYGGREGGSSGYGRQEEERGGYGRQEESGGYGSSGYRQGYESRGYGGDGSGRRGHSGYGESEGRGLGGGYGGGDEGGQGYGGGYNPGYGGDQGGRGYAGGSDETFGAERLNINEEGEERPHHGRHHHHRDDGGY